MPTDLPPGYEPPGSKQPEPRGSLQGLIGLAIICATLVAIVWLVTR